MPVLAFNDFLLFPAMLSLASLFGAIRVGADSFPTPWQNLTYLALLTVIQNTLFYFLHRLLHEVPSLYFRVHKLHHSYHSPCVLAANFFHPAEMLLCVFMPSAVGVVLLGQKLHLFTVCMMVWIRTCDGYEGHAGYVLPWSPLGINAQFHSLYHTQNKGHFSSTLHWWDWVLGTSD